MPVPLRANANLRAEAKYNVVTEFSNYGLHSAAASGNRGLVEYALTRGQPVNSVLDGVLPLHAACAGGDEQVVKLLIDHGADVNAPRLPRRYSNDKNRDASVPIVGTTGSTPLHFAAANGNKNIITTLLLRGAHPDRRDKHGITPAMLAEQHGWLECAQALNNWVETKDRDLREREVAVSHHEDPPADNEEESSGSARKRIQVKRSIDTALNMFKSSSSSLTNIHSRHHLSASTNNLNTVSPPTSPSRSRGDLSPSPSEDGRFSPSPSPIDPGARRPSLPHILQASHSSPSSRKPATLSKTPRGPRRPRSAGTDAERPDVEMSTSGSTGRGSTGRRLGTKYSLMNIFKKGQASESYGVPLERTTSHQTTNSASMTFYNSRSSQNNSFVNDSGPLPKPGFRFGSSSGNLSSSPSQTSHSLSHTRDSPSSSSVNQPYSPPRPTIPLAVDLHNAMYNQQNRARSGSSESVPRPIRSLPIPIPSGPSGSDDGHSASNSASLSTSPLARIALMTQTSHSRDRSGSASSLNRNAAVFDDDIVVAAGDQSHPGSRASPRPGILRAHNRTSSTGQGGALRALRFDSASSTSSNNRRDRDVDLSPPLRGSTSAGSLNRFRQRERRGSSRSPSRMLSPFDSSINELSDTRVPGYSAPAAITDFDVHTRNPIEDEEDEDAYYYGQPIQTNSSATHLPTSQFRHRGASFASSTSSLSPSLTPADVSMNSTDVASGDFPFSINRPPPTAFDETETSGSGSRLQVPSAIHTDNRARGDSISSVSTNDSAQNPDLSASGTSNSGGSETVKTPMRSPEALPALILPGGTELNGLRAPDGIGIASIAERRSQSPLRHINLDLVQSHAQAEALVQQKKQDILSAHSEGSVQAATTSGYTPLSARLAALGESLEIERKLREQKLAENKPEGVRHPSRASESTEVSAATLDMKKLKTSGGTSPPEDDLAVKTHHTRPTHHPSLSASAVEYSPTLGPTYDFAIPNPRSYTEASYMRPLPLRARTPDPILNLSRVSSLEGFHDGHDTDTELALCRVSTAPHAASKGQRDRNMVASNAKLTRMGFSPNDLSAGRAASKRFGGLRSFVQTLKGKQ